jgi:hypothetical protein
MSNIKLDLSQFKHKSSDKDSTTLVHDKLGHSITLSHKTLTPENQKQLQALSKMSANSQTPLQADDAKHQTPRYANGGRIPDTWKPKAKKMADGGDVTDDTQTPPQALDPNAPQATLQTATQPDLSANMNNFYTPEQIEQQKRMADLYNLSPEMMHQAMAAAVGSMGVVGEGAAEADSAAEGLAALEGKAAPNGKLVQIPGKAPKPWEPGGTPNWKPGQNGTGIQVKAKGGAVQRYAGGTDYVEPGTDKSEPFKEELNALDTPPAALQSDPTNSQGLYTTDPQTAMPAINQAYNRGKENAVEDRKQRYLEPFNITGETDPKAAELRALNDVNNEQLDTEKTKQQQALMDQKIAAKKAELGLGSPAAQMTPTTSGEAVTGETPREQAAPPQDPSLDPSAGVMQGYQNQMTGVQNEATAKGKLGEAQANIINQQVSDQNAARAAFQQHYNELDKERQAHIADIQNGYIDPNKYWTGDANGNGSHSKIAAGIGMLLAGFNPTGNPNAAVNFLKYQMDQNMEAQKSNLGAKQNLLNANLHQFGNLKDATEMTRLMQNDVLSHQLQSAAATAQNPMAKAQALQAVGQLQRDSAIAQQGFAMRRAMINMANDPNGQSPGAINQMIGLARVTNPEMAKDMESRYVPGVGMSPTTPIPSEVRQKLVGFQNLDKQANDLYNFTKTHSTIVPGTPDYNVGAQKALVLQSAIREGQLGTVYKAGEQPLLDKFVNSNPAGAFKMIQTEPQLKELIQSNGRQMDVLKRSYGLPVAKPAAAPSFQEGQTAVNKQGKRITFKNGKWQ